MTQTATVVTTARFAAGLSYKDFLGQAKVNVDKFDENYATARVSPDDAAFFKKLAANPAGPARVIVLGEDWCPDVYRGLPVIARIAEAAGMEFKAFPRDKNLDVMSEFLNQGTFQSIPVAVFYTRDMKYICHWTERPAFANADRAKIGEQIRKDLPGITEEDFRVENRKRTSVRYPLWQQETIKEIRQLLAGHVKGA